MVATGLTACALAQTPGLPPVNEIINEGTPSEKSENAGWGFLKCPASGQKHEAGAAIGSVVGGVAGNRLGGEDNRMIGTAVGAAAGGLAGSWIGCHLQKGDQRRAEQARQKALAEDRTQSWSNPETGASGEVRVRRPISATPAQQTQARSLASMRFLPGVDVEHRYEKLTGQYRVLKTSNLRAGSSTATRILGKLTPGEVVSVSGKSLDRPWYLITRNDTAVGYVHSSLVSANHSPNSSTRVATTTTSSASSCRVVEEVIRVSGDVTTQSYRACPTGDGGWHTTQI